MPRAASPRAAIQKRGSRSAVRSGSGLRQRERVECRVGLGAEIRDAAAEEDVAYELAARADLAAPDNFARLAIERPEHAGLLAGTEQVAHDAADLRVEEDRVRAEVGVRPPRRREGEEIALRHLPRPAQGAC